MKFGGVKAESKNGMEKNVKHKFLKIQFTYCTWGNVLGYFLPRMHTYCKHTWTWLLSETVYFI